MTLILDDMISWYFGHRKPHHHHHHHHHHPHQKLSFVSLKIDNFYVLINPNERLQAMTDVTVGHSISFGISYLDQNGNPMLVTPTPDSPPSWTNSTPATETLVVNPDGSGAVATTVAVGTDVVSLSVVVGGATFSATIGVNVTEVPQVLTSVEITAAVS